MNPLAAVVADAAPLAAIAWLLNNLPKQRARTEFVTVLERRQRALVLAWVDRHARRIGFDHPLDLLLATFVREQTGPR